MSLPVIEPDSTADDPLATSTRHWLLPEHDMVPVDIILPPLLKDKLHLPLVQDRLPPISSVSFTLTRLEQAPPEQLTVPLMEAVPASMDSKLPLTAKFPECVRLLSPLISPVPVDMLPSNVTSDAVKDILSLHEEHAMALPLCTVTVPAPD
jgi:hypothetical protein